MNKVSIVVLTIFSFFVHAASAQSVPEPWIPSNANTEYPRTLISKQQLNSLKSSLAAGVNNDLLNELYIRALQASPAGNTSVGDRGQRASLAKNAAFFVLLNVKPTAGGTTPLTSIERTNLINKSRMLLEEINAFVNQFGTDSPSNYIEWQWNSKQIIDFVSAYDMLRGAGVDTNNLALARLKVKTYAGNLYLEASKQISFTSFFQSAKNNHALMTTGALGIAAVVLNDLTDTLSHFKPTNWINAAMWNTFNVMWWDLRRQSTPGKYAGYAEGPYYMRYAFVNLLPFFRAMGNFLPDTSIEFKYFDVPRKIRNPWYDTNYVFLYDWMQAIRMPDGRFPPIEDSYAYKGFPELALLGKPKYNWPLNLSQLNVLSENTLSEQLRGVFDMTANYIAANTPIQNYQDSLFRSFPEAGIAVWRSSWDSTATYLALIGKNGAALTAAESHNQADDGSFLLMANQQMMAIDPGYLSFDMRDTVSKAEDHNMILVNNKGPLPGIPGKSLGAASFIEKEFSSPVQDYAELRTNYENTDINRKVLFVRKKYFLLIDHVQGGLPSTYQWLLHGNGLQGGNATTGTFTDLTSLNKGVWQFKNAGLLSYTNSPAPLQFSKLTGKHEISYENIGIHTYLKVSNTNPTTDLSFITCLQPFKNLQTDSIPVQTIQLNNAIAYKMNQSGYTDIAITKSDNTTQIFSKTATGLNQEIQTDAQMIWASQSNNTFADFFVYKATQLSIDGDTIFTSPFPKNMQYVKIGSNTITGYCGDTGTVYFHTGAYPFMFTGSQIWSVKYNSTSKIAEVYFNKPCRFSFILDDTKLQDANIYQDADFLKVYPVPATKELRLSFKINEEPYVIGLYDLNGKLLKTQVVYMENETTLPIDNLSEGLYILQVHTQTGKHIASRKIIKTNQ